MLSRDVCVHYRINKNKKSVFLQRIQAWYKNTDNRKYLLPQCFFMDCFYVPLITSTFHSYLVTRNSRGGLTKTKCRYFCGSLLLERVFGLQRRVLNVVNYTNTLVHITHTIPTGHTTLLQRWINVNASIEACCCIMGVHQVKIRVITHGNFS